jgi:hypothetical protein
MPWQARKPKLIASITMVTSQDWENKKTGYKG